MNIARRHEFVLAIYPTARGFAYALFEGPLSPVDWGIARRSGKRKIERCLRMIAALFLRYEPDLLVLQDTSPAGTLRSKRIRNLNSAISEMAERHGIPVRCYSRAEVRLAFNHLKSPSKQAIAESIAKHIPAFERYVPRPRKRHVAEDNRLNLFDAAALALTFFRSETDGKTKAD
jgi:hypothetical protein